MMAEFNSDDETLSLMNATQGWNLDSGGARDPYDGGVYTNEEDQDEFEDEYEGDPLLDVECSCWDSDLRICSECRHQRGCLEISCGYLEHFDVDESPKSGDQNDFDADDNDDDDDDDGALEVSSESTSAICKCDSSKKYHCPSCSHIESCYLRVACSEYWFHFPGQGEPEIHQPNSTPSHETAQAEFSSRNGAYWTLQEDEQLSRLFIAGWGIADIAAELKRSERSITFRLSMLCLELNGIHVDSYSSEAELEHRPWSANDDGLLTTLFVNKSNLAVLSQALKRTQSSIGERLIFLRLVTIGDLSRVKYYSGAGATRPGM